MSLKERTYEKPTLMKLAWRVLMKTKSRSPSPTPYILWMPCSIVGVDKMFSY